MFEYKSRFSSLFSILFMLLLGVTFVGAQDKKSSEPVINVSFDDSKNRLEKSEVKKVRTLLKQKFCTAVSKKQFSNIAELLYSKTVANGSQINIDSKISLVSKDCVIIKCNLSVLQSGGQIELCWNKPAIFCFDRSVNKLVLVRPAAGIQFNLH